MSVEVRRLSGALGAEVRGLNLADPSVEMGAVEELFAQHHERPEFGMRYPWSANTLGIWDNRWTLHYASNDYPGQLPVMHRLVVLEDIPPAPKGAAT